MSLQDDIEYLKARLFALEDRVKTSPHFRWGTVVTSVPLTIILDGAAGALPGTPANAGPKVLMVGERVRVELQGNRAVVHAVGGRVNDLRGTSTQRVALAMSGAARDGMRFYDEDENREYVWIEDSWAFAFYTTTLSVSVTGSAGATASVDFPAGAFTRPPGVLPVKTSGVAAKYIPYVSSVTATGCTIGIYSGDGSAGTHTAQIRIFVFPE